MIFLTFSFATLAGCNFVLSVYHYFTISACLVNVKLIVNLHAGWSVLISWYLNT